MSTNNFSVINPYELLGFDSKNPNIQMKDLKNAYYTLSLICHPDKGGNADDMVILQNAYLYIKNQIEYKDEKSLPFEKIEKEFKEFMEEQTKKPQPFSEIYEETHVWLQEFNNYFKKNYNNSDIYLDPNEDGYGALMDQSIQNEEDTNYADLETKVSYQFKNEIAVYQEPSSFITSFSNGFEIDGKKINNFTRQVGDMTLSDYKQAFTDSEIESIATTVIEKNNEDVEKNFEKAIKDRSLLLQEIDNTNSSIFNKNNQQSSEPIELRFNTILKAKEEKVNLANENNS